MILNANYLLSHLLITLTNQLPLTTQIPVFWFELNSALQISFVLYCLKQVANDLHMVQLMPLLTLISCSIIIQNG